MIKCCKDCKKRYVGCHSKCEDYLSESAETTRNREKKYQEQRTISSIYAPWYKKGEK